MLADRKDAFIGYREQALECTDTLPTCRKRSHASGCLLDPWVMRRFCPVSCNVDRCTAPGPVQARHKGSASSGGTLSYAVRPNSGYAAAHFRPTQLVPTDPLLQLSSLGVGTYLGAVDAETDEAVTTAVIHSVARGYNVIDTASTYRDGQAEVAVGRALEALLAGDAAAAFPHTDPEVYGDVLRDQLFISTKAGFVDSTLLKPLLKSRQLLRSDVVQDAHTLHPTYLDKSLQMSLTRMGLQTVDLLYLHNAAEMQLPAVGRVVFMERLKAAFAYLEAAKADGLLQYYGLATWDCFRVPPGHKLHMALEDVVALAREVGGPQHAFRFVQLPVNVAMTEAHRQPWQRVGGTNYSLVHAAKLLQVGVFTSGPLGEAELVQSMMSALDGVAELIEQQSTAAKLLQVARSTPGIIASLVGHKTREFVEQNVELAKKAPLSGPDFDSVQRQVAALTQRRR